MKFLCVKCDEPMKLVSTAPPERGSLSVVYSCPRCSHEIAMLTNPYETQLVQSLGVRIGPAESPHAGSASAKGDLSGCPFAGMVQEMERAEPSAEVAWTSEAQQRLEKIPEFVRPMARAGIERFAKDRGHDRVDEEIVDQAKEFFGM